MKMNGTSLDRGNSTATASDEVEWVGVVEAILLALILLAAVLGNALVCAVVYRRRELRRTVTHIFIMALAVTDIAVALLCMPFSIVTAVTQWWVFGGALCHVNGFLNVFFLLASILTLAAISVYKYIRVVKSVRVVVSRQRALIGLAGVWVFALFTALSPLTGWNEYVYINGRTQCSIKVPENAAELTNCLFVIVCGFVVPLGVISFSYRKIFHTVTAHTKRIKGSRVFDKRQLSRFLSEKHITTTLFIILTVFLCCWAPFSVLTFYATVARKELPQHFSVAAYWLGFLNSALNPVIYALRTREFRDGYREILGIVLPCCFKRLVRRSINSTLKWSQNDFQSRRSSAFLASHSTGAQRQNSVSTSEGLDAALGKTRTRAATEDARDIDLIKSPIPAGEVARDEVEMNDTTSRDASRGQLNRDAFDWPLMGLERGGISPGAVGGELDAELWMGTSNRCFLQADHEMSGVLDCSVALSAKLRRPRSQSDSAVKYRQQQRRRAMLQ